MEPITGFIPPETSPRWPVLARFLTPLPVNVAAAYIAAYTQEGDVVVNPFCQSAGVAQEAARLGRRAILSDFNPLTIFTVRAALSTVSAKEITAGFHRLAETLKGDSPLRSHLLQLYQTTCPHCHQPATAHHFVWSRQLDRPIQKSYHCRTCQRQHLEPTDENDLAALQKIDSRGFHYWALLDRLSPPDEEVKALAQRLLALYTPRNLYALATLSSKAEAVFDAPPLLEAFRLILLECLDRGSKLTPAAKSHASRSVIPRPPAQFLEVNVWEAFEASYQALQTYRQKATAEAAEARLVNTLEEIAPRTLTLWTLPRQERALPVLVKRISARRLGEELPPASTALLLAEPPTLAQATFLPLAYLWTGWLLGKEAAQVFQPDPLLHPRRPDDWPWYLQAMTTSLRSLTPALTEQGHAALIFTESDLARVRALLLAAAAANLRLDHLLYQPLPATDLTGAAAYGGTPGRYTLCFSRWLTGAAKPSTEQPAIVVDSLAAQVQNAGLRAARDLLAQRGEPSLFSWLHHAICQRLAQDGLLQEIMQIKTEDFSPLEFLAQNVQAGLEKGLKRDLVQIAGSKFQVPSSESPVPDTNGQPALPVLWWLAKPRAGALPLSDRVEEAVYNVLSTSLLPTVPAISKVIYSLFPGLQTPEPGLIEAAVDSYSVPASATHRQLRQEDHLELRDQEHLGFICLLADLGHRLGFRVLIARAEQKRKIAQGTVGGLLDVKERYANPQTVLGEGDLASEIDVVWYKPDQTMLLFEVSWTARLHQPLVEHRVAAGNVRRYLVIPEERVDLIRFKLERSLLWQQIVAEDGWDFIKYNHLRQFAGGHPEIEDFPSIVGLKAPVEQYGTQMRMF